MDLAAGFLFRILLCAEPTLQTDLARWRSAVAALEDAEPKACRAVWLPGSGHVFLEFVRRRRSAYCRSVVGVHKHAHAFLVLSDSIGSSRHMGQVLSQTSPERASHWD